MTSSCPVRPDGRILREHLAAGRELPIAAVGQRNFALAISVHNTDRDRPLWHRFILTLACSLLIAGCTTRFEAHGWAWRKDEPPPTLYVFNVDPPDGDIMVFEEVPKTRSFAQVFFNESPYDLEPIASVGSQRFVRVSLLPGDRTLRAAGGREPRDKLASLMVSADPGGVYYVKVYRPTTSAWVTGLIAGELIVMVVTLGRGEDVLITGLLMGRPAQIESINSDEAQDLMKQLKPQETSERRNTPG